MSSTTTAAAAGSRAVESVFNLAIREIERINSILSSSNKGGESILQSQWHVDNWGDYEKDDLAGLRKVKEIIVDCRKRGLDWISSYLDAFIDADYDKLDEACDDLALESIAEAGEIGLALQELLELEPIVDKCLSEMQPQEEKRKS